MPTLRAVRVQRRLLALALLPLLSLATLTHAQSRAAPTTQPLFANLTTPLDIANAKVGSKFQARLTAPWSGNGCDLRQSALIQGHVTQVEHRSKTAPRSSLSIVFDSAECNRQRNTPFNAILIALLGPPDAPDGMGKAPPLTDIPLPIGMRSVETAAGANQYALTGHSIPNQWKVGMVVDVPMNLTVGTVADPASTIWSTTTSARLEGQTTLILLATPPPAPAPPTP